MRKVELKTGESHRAANWLELFYDLIYVIVIARLTHMIIEGHGGHVGSHEIITYFALFVPIWWAWTGHMMLENRFGNDDFIDRLLTLTQMFGLILLAVFVTDALGKGAVGFALSYAFVRFLLVAMYGRVHLSNVELRPVTARFIGGYSIGAGLWALSVLFSPPLMFVFWVIGLAIDMLTPILNRKCLAKVSVHGSHLPERTGLLFIIVLGESLLVLVNSIENGALDQSTLIRLLLAFALVAAIWWLYFEAMERALIGKLGDTAQLHIYGHLPIYIGLGLLAAFCHRLLDSHGDSPSTGLLLAASLALILIPLRAIQSQTVTVKAERQGFGFYSLLLVGLVIIIAALAFILSSLHLTLATLAMLVGYTFIESRVRA